MAKSNGEKTVPDRVQFLMSPTQHRARATALRQFDSRSKAAELHDAAAEMIELLFSNPRARRAAQLAELAAAAFEKRDAPPLVDSPSLMPRAVTGFS
jgi:hypothetical protein